MSYTIKIVDLEDPVSDLELRKLIQAAFNSSELLPEKYISANLRSGASAPSLFLAAYEGDSIIGCNGFLANDFLLGGARYTGFQSCWSATHPDHQGKKIFSSIIEYAKLVLRENGAGFLFGLANNNSNPIFTKKLGFTETPTLSLRILNIPFLRKNCFTNAPFHNNNDACTIHEDQVMKHKLEQFPASIKVVRYNNSWLWGKRIIKRKWGVSLPAFYVGGVELSLPADLQGLVSELFRQHKVFFITFLSCESNSFNVLLKGWKPAKMNGFIFYNLGMPDFKHFNLMIGIIDIF